MASLSATCAGTRLRQWAHLDEAGGALPPGFEDVQEWREFEIPFKAALSTLVRLVAARFPAEAIKDAASPARLGAALQAVSPASSLPELVRIRHHMHFPEDQV